MRRPERTRRIQKFLTLHIFESRGDAGVGLAGTPYSYWPASTGKWYEFKTSPDRSSSGYIRMPLDEILEKIPEEARKILLFNLDLVT